VIGRTDLNGSTWREQQDLVEEWTFVACRCGVDMQFEWPRTRQTIRCFGCGARFRRPSHLSPQQILTPWRRPTLGLHLLARWRSLATPQFLALLGLTLLTASLLGLGLGLLLGS
jgi:hypothetical protein